MSNDNKGKTRYYAKLFGFRRAVPIILTALSLFITVCFFTEGAGLLGGAVSSLLKGLFSVGAYLIPALLLLHAIFYASDYVKRLTVSRTIFSVVAIFLASGIEYIVYYWNEPAFVPTECYVNQTAGGFLGSTVAFALTKALGPIGLIILSVTVIAVYVTYFFATGNSVASKSVMRVFTSIKDFFGGIASKARSSKEQKRAKQAELEHLALEKNSNELLADNFFGTDESVSELKIEKLGINEKNVQPEPAEPTVEQAVAESSQKADKKPEAKRRPLNLDYGLGIEGPAKKTMPEQKVTESFSPAPAEQKASGTVSRGMLGLDDSADNVFTKEFDPFDFATAEKIAARSAPRARVGSSGISEVATPLSRITESDIDRLRAKEAEQKRKEEFDERKRRILENISSRQPSASAPAAAPTQQTSTYSAPAAAPAQQTNTYSAPAAAPAQQTSTYSAPAAAPAQQTNTYSAPSAAPAQQTSTYSAPAAAPAQQASTYSAPVAADTRAEDHRKSIEFNVSNSEDTSAPSESDSVTFVFDKSEHYPDETQRIAAEVARMLEENVTGYTRSANKSFTYTKVTENTPSAAESSFDGAAITAKVVPSSPATGGYSAEENLVSVYSEAGVGVQNAAKEQAPDYPIINEYSTEKAPEITESIASFDEYRGAGIPEAPTSPAPSEELKIERTMIEPSVDSGAEYFSERDKKFTIISADKECDSADFGKESAQASEDLFSALNSEPATELSFGELDMDAGEKSAPSGDISEIFGDDEEEELSEEELSPEEEGDEPEEIPPEEQNPEILKQRQMFPFLDSTPASGSEPDENIASSQDASYTSDEDEDDFEDEPPFDVPESPSASAAQGALITQKEAKKATSKAPSYKNYKFPSLDILSLNEEVADSNIDAEIEENAERLIDTLSSFNVTASIKGVDRGPRITRYEVVPSKGVKVSSIMNLQDDIALSLAADGIRMEAPIPGKSAVGVEIPNKHDTTVKLRELLETEDFKNSKSKTTICIGKDVAGQPVINDIAKMPHLLIAGATGMGKSVCINSLLISILYKARPDEVKFIMIDPKQVEFTMYNGIPHLLIPVVSDAKQAAGALMWAVDEMEKRFTLLNSACVRNIDGYNEKVAEDPSLGEPMSKIIIVIDEFADLMLQVKDPVESLVMRIAQKARAAGIHLIIGTQRPSTNVITGTIKANIPSRMSCKVASNVDSRTVLDSVGAEKLLNRGDMLFAYAGAIKPLRVQGAFVSDGEVQNIMSYLKQFSTGDNYDESVMEEIKRQAAKCNKKGSDGDDGREGDDSSGEGYLNDRQFLEAVEVAVNSGKISTSLLQRRISIGYGKAAKFIDVMCDMGIVGESNGSKPREVLITADEWREKLSRLSYD